MGGGASDGVVDAASRGAASRCLRAAYLAWLLAVQDDEVDPDACEPPVPSGLGELSAPLMALVDFLRIDQDLLEVATQSSGEKGDDAGRFREWVRQLPAGEQQRWLLRAADNPELALALQRRS